ncbi:hypothetical protein AMECASPLE_028786 [Ameca splendens]|uniref:Uncharacterized protein n=1 Tax=Ameca splendens TaxID=208324 RepID=A0ABV0Y5T0_9TELE
MRLISICCIVHDDVSSLSLIVIYNAPCLWRSSLVFCMQQVPALLTLQAGAESRGNEALICSGMLLCSHHDPRTKSILEHSSLLLHQQALLLCSVWFSPPFFLCFVLVILPT